MNGTQIAITEAFAAKILFGGEVTEEQVEFMKWFAGAPMGVMKHEDKVRILRDAVSLMYDPAITDAFGLFFDPTPGKFKGDDERREELESLREYEPNPVRRLACALDGYEIPAHMIIEMRDTLNVLAEIVDDRLPR